jgi:drug/metabolite transporter (DMT)-like permease
MLVGLIVVLPAVLVQDLPAIGGTDAGWLTLSGAGNVVGLLCAYAALRIGKVGIVAPIVSTEGAIAAVIAVAAGEGLSRAAGGTLAVIACGIALAGATRDADEAAADAGRGGLLLAIAAALAFGISLYATARVGASLSIAWAVLPARAIGVAAVTLPLAASRRLVLPRGALPFVLLSGVCEVAGFGSFAIGSRHGIAVSAVLASQFAALAAVAAYFLFGERLARVQIAGVVAIVAGVGVLSALQA